MEKKKIPKKESGGISRRDFLKDAGLLVGGAAIGSSVLLAACGGEETTKTVTEATTKTVTETAPGGTQTITITKTVEGPGPVEELQELIVNGKIHVLKIEPHWTLAFVLRDILGLTGTKVACDKLMCGACTVLVDGEPMASCSTLAIEVEGKEILTIEGLQDGDKPHPIQEAWLEEHGTQCGFCAPGNIMAAKALLDKNDNPSEEEVREALAGNICRCSNYNHIVNAVMSASQKIREA